VSPFYYILYLQTYKLCEKAEISNIKIKRQTQTRIPQEFLALQLPEEKELSEKIDG